MCRESPKSPTYSTNQRFQPIKKSAVFLTVRPCNDIRQRRRRRRTYVNPICSVPLDLRSLNTAAAAAAASTSIAERPILGGAPSLPPRPPQSVSLSVQTKPPTIKSFTNAKHNQPTTNGNCKRQTWGCCTTGEEGLGDGEGQAMF